MPQQPPWRQTILIINPGLRKPECRIELIFVLGDHRQASSQCLMSKIIQESTRIYQEYGYGPCPACARTLNDQFGGCVASTADAVATTVNVSFPGKKTHAHMNRWVAHKWIRFRRACSQRRTDSIILGFQVSAQDHDDWTINPTL